MLAVLGWWQRVYNKKDMDLDSSLDFSLGEKKSVNSKNPDLLIPFFRYKFLIGI